MKYLMKVLCLPVLAILILLTSCGEEIKREAPPQSGKVPMQAFACGADDHYLAIYSPVDETVTLLGPGGAQVLVAEPAASGAKYSAAGMTLWSKGEDISLAIDGKAFQKCRTTGRQKILADAWSENVVFLATGQEPPWTLQATAIGVVLSLGYENVTRTFSGGLAGLPGGLYPTGRFVLTDSEGEMVVQLSEGPCSDTMSGAPYSVRVTVMVGENRWQGCGLALP